LYTLLGAGSFTSFFSCATDLSVQAVDAGAVELPDGVGVLDGVLPGVGAVSN
jgi:hypothetical protein